MTCWRRPDVVLGDLQAQAAACRIAERGMVELAERYGVAELTRYFDELGVPRLAA